MHTEQRQGNIDRDYVRELCKVSGMDSANTSNKVCNNQRLILQLRQTVAELVDQVEDLAQQVGHLRGENANGDDGQVLYEKAWLLFDHLIDRHLKERIN